MGQDTNELTGGKTWWEKIPVKRQLEKSENTTEVTPQDSKQDKYKDLVDPLNTVRRYLGTEGVQNIIKKSRKTEEIDYKTEKSEKEKKTVSYTHLTLPTTPYV